MRHGEPDTSMLSGKFTSKEFLNCLELYRSCGLLDTSKPEEATIEFFSGFNTVVSSGLKRSVDSATLLSPRCSLVIDPMFREIEDTFISVPFIKLTPRTWSRIFILLWFIGVFDFKKAFRDGETRASNCARKLIHYAEERGTVLLVGHGFINSYIAKELIALGWHGPKLPGKYYWEYAVYQKPD